MRTTLDIDSDVLLAAKELAQKNGVTLGVTISQLARQTLVRPASLHSVSEPSAVYGFQPFPATGALITSEQVNRLRDDE